MQIDKPSDIAAGALRSSSNQPVQRAITVWGQEVTVDGKQSPFLNIVDAQEELSFAVAEKMDNKRELSRLVSEKNDPFARMLELRIEAILKKMPDLERQLKDFMANNKDIQGLDAEEVLQLIKQSFSDPAQRYIVLAKLFKDLSAGRAAFVASLAESEELKRRVEKETSKLWNDDGEKVRAGINIADASKLFWREGELSKLGSLRSLYYDAVLDFGGVLKTFDKVTEHSGEGGYSTTIMFLIKALVDDLRAMSSSIEKPRLEAIVKDIRLLKSMESIKNRCSVVVARLELEASSHRLLRVVLRITEGVGTAASEVSDLMVAVALSELKGKIYLTQQVKEVIELVPLGLFSSVEDRGRIMENIQVLLDDLVFSEEDLEES